MASHWLPKPGPFSSFVMVVSYNKVTGDAVVLQIEQKKWRGKKIGVMERNKRGGRRKRGRGSNKDEYSHVQRTREYWEYLCFIDSCSRVIFSLEKSPHYNSSVPAVVLKDIWWHTKIGNTHEFQKRGSINEHKSETFSDQAFISFGRSRLPRDENRPRWELRNIMRTSHKVDTLLLTGCHDLPLWVRRFQIKTTPSVFVSWTRVWIIKTLKVHKVSTASPADRNETRETGCGWQTEINLKAG